MSPLLLATTAFVVGAVLSATLTLTLLSARARRRCAGLPFFRCRIGPPNLRRWRGRARWCLRRTSAAWVDGVLLVRSGALRLWLTPLSVTVAGDVEVRALPPGEARGLGPHPLVLSFTGPTGNHCEIAAAAESAERLVGPFLAATVAGLPGAHNERGG
jgi:hypothetical protein